MGVSVSKTNNKQDKPDAEYSQLHLSAVFNEAFVSGVFEQLPEYLTDLSALEDEDFSDSVVKKDSDDLCRLKRIMTILGPSSKEENDVDQWSIGGTAEKSLFASNNKKRVRLLLRIYQAYNNLLAQYRPTLDQEGSLTQAVVPMLPSLSLAVQDSSSDAMAAMSIGMSTAMAKVLGKTNSLLYLSIADTLMGIAGSLKPVIRNSPADSTGNRGGALTKALDSLKELAAEMMQCDTPEVKSAGLGLMLAVAQVSGSLQEVLQVVLLLLKEDSGHACALPAKALESFSALIQPVPKYRISLPARKNAVDEYKFTCLPPLQDCDRTRLRDHPGLCGLATDGTALYAYQSLTTGASLTKIGTGMHGTLVGDVLAAVSDVKALVQDFRCSAQTLDRAALDTCEAAAGQSWENFPSINHNIATTAAATSAVVYPSFFPAGAVAGMRHHHITDTAPFTVSSGTLPFAGTVRMGCYLDMPFDFRDAGARAAVVAALDNNTVGNYWEFTVLSLGVQVDEEDEDEDEEEEEGVIAFGFAAAESYGVNGTRVVGWDSHSFGYHSDDGNIFVDGETTGDWPSFAEGDVVGCGLEVREDDATLYFTKNSARLLELRVPLGHVFYPVVTLQGTECTVRVNTGAQPFVYQGAEVKVKSRNPEVTNSVAGSSFSTAAAGEPLVGTVAVSQGRALLRLQGACLASTEIAVLTPALAVERILDVGKVLAAHQVDTTALVRESESVFVFALQDKIDVRATQGRRIQLLSGFWRVSAGDDQPVDVAVVLRPFLRHDGSLLVSEVSVQEALAGCMPTGACEFTLHCNLEELTSAECLQAAKKEVRKSLCLPFAAAGNVVVCLQAPPERSPVGCFCPIQSLDVLSAVRGEVSPTSDPAEGVHDAAIEVWRRHWAAFLQRSAIAAPGQADCDTAALWAELAALNLQGPELFTVTFRAKTAQGCCWRQVFPVGEAPDFHRTLATLEAYMFPNPACPVIATVMELTDSLQLRVIKQVALKLQSGDCADRFDRASFEKKSLLFNGARLLIFSPADLRCTWQFDLRSDSGDSVGGDSMGWQAATLDDKAVHFARDMRNHCVWAWNPINCSAVLWRNRVASVPSWKCTAEQFRPNAAQVGQLSPIAYQRMEALQEPGSSQTASGAAALLLTMLEHQSEPYGPTDWEAEVAGAEQLFRIRLVCQYPTPSSKTPSLSVIFRGNKADLIAPKNDNQTVFNVVTLDANFDHPRAQEIPVSDAEHHVRRLMEALESVAPGTMVLIAAAEVPSRVMRAVARAFTSIGLQHLDESANYRSILVIGRKGMATGTALCTFGKSGESLSLECTLPLRTVPVALELTADTMQALLGTLQRSLNQKFMAAVVGNSASVSSCKMSILATVQLLKVHVFRISLVPAEEAGALVSAEWCAQMRELLGQLIHSPMLLQDRPIEDAVLGLFVSAVGVLYPSLQDLQALLFRYMEQYTNRAITHTEMVVLEFVLKKITEPGPLMQLLQQDDQRAAVSSAEDPAAKALSFLVALQNIFLGEFKRSLAVQAGGEGSGTVRGKIGSTAVAAMEAFCKLLLVKGADAFVASADGTVVQSEETCRRSRQAGAQMLVKTVVAIARQCQEVIETAAHSCTGSPEELLLQSPVHTLLPLVLSVLSNLAACHRYDFIHPVIDSIAELMSTLSELHSALHGVVAQLPSTDCAYSDLMAESAPAFQVVDSEHPYRSNMDEEVELSFPGATSLSIAFDSQTRTENGCDYVQFRDTHGNSLHGDRYTGRDGSENWPGFNGRPPLVTENSTVLVYFHTDGSVEDWGYRFTVTPTYPPKPSTGAHSTHWLVRLEFELAQCTAALASVLVTGLPWQESLETPNAVWMHSPLVRPELFRWEATAERTEDALLSGLVDRPEESLSAKLAQTMRACVREDQGTVEVINRAVYAACGAIIKCNGLAKEALTVATGASKTVPVALVKAWRAGQKLRTLLSAGTPAMSMSEGSEGGVSEEDASDAAHLRDLSDAIVERALFLLRSPLSAEVSSSTAVEQSVVLPPLSPASASLHPYALQPPSRDSSPSKTDQLGPPLSSSGAPLSALGSPVGPSDAASSGREAGFERIPMQRQLSADTRNVSNLWHSLVEDEAVVDKLKKLLEHRKRLAATSHRKHEQSITDKVLAFVQSTVAIGQLEEVNALRNKRAILRAKGLDVFTDLLVGCSHPFALTVVVKALRRALQCSKRGEDETAGTAVSRLHFFNAVEGCSPEQAGLVWQKFASLMRVLVGALSRGRYEVSTLRSAPVGVGKPSVPNHVSGWEQAVVSCLRCCAVDFEVADQIIVSESGLLQELRALLESPSAIVANAAEGLFGGLVTRCLHPVEAVNGSGKSGETHMRESNGGVQDLTRSLLETMLQRVVSTTAQVVPTQDDSVVVVPCRRFQPGSVGALGTLRSCLTTETEGVSHSYSMWIKRPYSPLLDAADPSELSVDGSTGAQPPAEGTVGLTVGTHVIPGPDFDYESNEFGGGWDTIGTVSKPPGTDNAVSVLWPNGKTTKCVYNPPSKVQVVRADPAVGGHIFSEGTPGVLDSSLAAVDGLVMLPDATLRLVPTKPNLQASKREERRVSPDQWVHVTVTVSLQGCSLWINGKSVEVVGRTEGALMSNMPLYLGQVPFAGTANRPSPTQLLGAATITDASTALGWNGMLAALTVLQSTANGDPIAALMHSSKDAVSQASQVWDDAPLLSILAVLKKGVGNLRDHRDPSVIAALSQPPLLDAIFSVLSAGTALSKCYMYRICASIFPILEVGVVRDAAMRCKGFLGGSTSFVESLLESVGRACNVWGRGAADDGAEVGAVRVCGDAQYGVAMSQLALLRTLAVSQDSTAGSSWRAEVGSCLKAVLSQARKIVDSLATHARSEMQQACALRSQDACLADVGKCNQMYALLALLGGDFPVLYVGALGMYVDEVSGTREDCVVLGYSAVPVVDAKTDKAEAAKWNNAAAFGDAVAIMVLSNTGVPLVVHKDSLEFTNFPSSSSEEDRQLSLFLEEHVGADRVAQLFGFLANVDSTDRRPIPQPRTEQVVEELVFESPHPRVPSSDIYRAISIPGAVDLTVTFDPRSDTSRREYCVFFKDRSRTEAWGTRYCGSDTDGTWCGVRGNPPLRIPGSSTEFKFHASSSSEEHWGYKFTITGTVVKDVLPPGLPTLPHFAHLAHMKMLGMKALRSSLTHLPWLLPRAMGLFRGLVQSALAPAPETPVLPVAAQTASTLTFESNHPYENSLDVYTPVCIPGAKRLSVVFDPETRTEQNCDYVELYTDSSHSTRVPGTEKYTGGKDGGHSNWPGLGDRPGLVIEGDSFEIYFRTDGSVNDWGYRMFVTADFGASASLSSDGQFRGAEASPAMAAERCFYLQQYLLDGAHRAKPFRADDTAQYTSVPARTRCRRFIDATSVEALAVQSGQKADTGECVAKEAVALPVQQLIQGEQSVAMPAGKVRVNQAYNVSLPMGYQVVETAGVDLLKALPEKPGDQQGKTGDQQEKSDTTESVLVRLPYAARVLAVEESGNYLKVQYWVAPVAATAVLEEGAKRKDVAKESPSQSSPVDDTQGTPSQNEPALMEGWVRRWAPGNVGKELMRADCSVEGSVLPIKLHRFPATLPPGPEEGRRTNTSSSSDVRTPAPSSKPVRHPMYSVTDSSDIGAEPGASNSDAFLRSQQRLSQCRLIGSEVLTLEPAIVEYSEIAALGYAFEAVAFLLVNWPEEEVMSVAHFGSLSNLLTFMNLSLLRRSTDGSGASHRKLWEVLRRSEELAETGTVASLSPALIAFASEHLRELVQSEKPAASLKPTLPAPARMACGTSVLLPLNGGSQTLCFPSALRWEIRVPDYTGEFLVSAQSNSSLQEPREVRLTEGTTQTLHLQGTEAVTVTWTPKGPSSQPMSGVHAAVIFAEADPAEVEAYREETTALQQRYAQSREKTFSPQLACWILHTYVAENSAQLGDVLYGVPTFTVLREFYESSLSGAVQAELAELFVAFLGAFRSRYAVLPEDLLRELCALKRALTATADREHRLQTTGGYKMQLVSPALQATVQLILSLDLCISPPLLLPATTSESAPEEVCIATTTQWVQRSSSWGTGMVFSAETETIDSDADTRSWTIAVAADSSREGECQEVSFGVCQLAQTACTGQQRAKLFVGYSTHGQVICGQGSDFLALYPSGQQRPLLKGDLLSVTVNRRDCTVLCSLNGALLHVLLGPPGSDALLELDWSPADTVPAVFSHLPSAVEQLPQLIQNPAALFISLPNIVAGNDNSQSTKLFPGESIVALKTPDWLEKVIAANSLLHSIEQRTLPRFVVRNLFLPMVTLRASREVDLRSEDFAGVAVGAVLSRTVSVPDSSALRICLNGSHLVAGDLLEVLDGQGAVVASIVSQGTQLTKRVSDMSVLVRKVIERAEKKAADFNSRMGQRVLPLLCSGDVVVRGPDWKQGDADGGAGSLGVVLTQKQGLLDTGVTVRWERSGNEGVARYTPSRREVLLLRKAPASLLDTDGGIDVTGATLTMRVTKLGNSDAAVERRLNVMVVPILPLESCLRSEENRALMQHFHRLYVPGEGSKGLEGDLALVRHIDSVAAAKKFTQYDLVKKSWTQLEPSAEDLTRSPALKALYEETVASLPQSCGATLSAFFPEAGSTKEDGRVNYAPQVRAIISSLSGSAGSSTTPATATAVNLLRQTGIQLRDTVAEQQIPVCKQCTREVFRHPAGTGRGGWTCDSPQHQGPNDFTGSDCLYGCASVVRCNWCLCQACFERDRTTQTAVSQRPTAWNRALLVDSTEDVEPQLPSITVGENGDVPRSLLAHAHDSVFGRSRWHRSPLPSPATAAPAQEPAGATITLGSAPPVVSEALPSAFIAATDAAFSLPPAPLRSALASQPPAVSFDTPVFRVGRMSHSSRSSSDDEDDSDNDSDEDNSEEDNSEEDENSTDYSDGDNSGHSDGSDTSDSFRPPWNDDDEEDEEERSEEEEEEGEGSEEEAVGRNPVLENSLFALLNSSAPSTAATESSEAAAAVPVAIAPSSAAEEQEQLLRAIAASLASAGASGSSTGADATSTGHALESQLYEETAHSEAEEGGPEMPVCKKCSREIFRHPPGTWSNGWTCDWPQHQGSNGFRSSDCVYGCVGVKPCNWGMCHVCFERCEAEFHAKRSRPTQDMLREVAQKSSAKKPIQAHFAVLQLLNQLFQAALPFTDLSLSSPVPGSLAYLSKKHRGLIFEAVKMAPITSALDATAATSSSTFDLTLSRSRARKHQQAGLPDKDARFTVFAQAFRVIHGMPPARLRRADKLYNTKFMGEHAVDGGGPYRESFGTYMQELQSGALPLLLHTQNGRQGVGQNREKWLLNPGARSPLELEMLAFLGKLLGIAVRSKEYLALHLPSLIWKLLVGDSPTVEDLEQVDFSLVRSLDLLRNLRPSDAAAFSQTFFETFTTTSSDDRTVELLPGGAQRDMTFETRHQYCDLVTNYRLHEFDVQAAAIRRGLATIVPLSLMSLLTWHQLEVLVCGKEDVDVELLQSVTDYSSCSSSDAHIRNFWQIMREFTNEERSALLRFTWGRSRLPLTAADFPQRFKLQSFNKRPADAYYPVAHTCFFSLELPKYSSLELMREKLRYAIFNCEAIDGDDTSSGDAIAALGWEE